MLTLFYCLQHSVRTVKVSGYYLGFNLHYKIYTINNSEGYINTQKYRAGLHKQANIMSYSSEIIQINQKYKCKISITMYVSSIMMY